MTMTKREASALMEALTRRAGTSAEYQALAATLDLPEAEVRREHEHLRAGYAALKARRWRRLGAVQGAVALGFVAAGWAELVPTATRLLNTPTDAAYHHGVVLMALVAFFHAWALAALVLYVRGAPGPA